MRTNKLSRLQVAGALAATLLLAACGSDNSGSTPASNDSATTIIGTTPKDDDKVEDIPPVDDENDSVVVYPSHYILTVELTGLESGNQLVLKDQAPGSVLDALTLTENGSFEFSGELKPNDVYDLAVIGLTQSSQFVDATTPYVNESARQRHQCNLTGGAGTADGVDQNVEVTIECSSDLVFTTFLDPDEDEYGITQFWSWDGVEKRLIHELAETQWIIHWFVVNNKLLLVIGDEAEADATLVQVLDDKGLQLLKRFNGYIYDDTLRFHDGSLYFIAEVESGAAPSFYRASDTAVTELNFDGSFVLSGNDRDHFTVGDAGVYATTDIVKRLWKLDAEKGVFKEVYSLVGSTHVIHNLSMAADKLYITTHLAPDYKYTLFYYDEEIGGVASVAEATDGLGYYLSVGEEFLFARGYGSPWEPESYSSSLFIISDKGEVGIVSDALDDLQHHSETSKGGFVWEGKTYFVYSRHPESTTGSGLWVYGDDGLPAEVVYEESIGTPSSTFYNPEYFPYRINNIYPLQDAVLVRMKMESYERYQFYMLTGSESGGLIERHLLLPENYLGIDAVPVAYMDGQIFFHGSAAKEEQIGKVTILVGEKGVWKVDLNEGVIHPVSVESFTPSEGESPK